MFSESRSESAFLLYVKSLHSRKKKKKKALGVGDNTTSQPKKRLLKQTFT